METWRYARLLILEEPDLGGYTPNDRDIHRCCIMQDQGFGASYQATLVRGVRDSEILPWPARLHPNHDSSGLYPAERERITPTFRIQFDRRYCTRRRRRSSRFSCDEVLEATVDSHYACLLHKARRRRLRAWLAYEIHVR